MRLRMTLVSKIRRFLIVRVKSESCRMFLDLTRGAYFLFSLDHLLRVQISQILNPQSIERVWSLLQLLHSRTTKSCPHFSNRSAKWELKSRRESATFWPSPHTRIVHTRTKSASIFAYLHQFVNTFCVKFLLERHGCLILCGGGNQREPYPSSL